jgi:site-specific DNA-methyltransferase (adenine-specific)
VTASSQPGSRVLDFFAGSGTTASVARELGRRFVMIDSNPDAIATMRTRLGSFETSYVDKDGSVLPPVE